MIFIAVPAVETEEKEKEIEFTYDKILLACKKYIVKIAAKETSARDIIDERIAALKKIDKDLENQNATKNATSLETKKDTTSAYFVKNACFFSCFQMCIPSTLIPQVPIEGFSGQTITSFLIAAIWPIISHAFLLRYPFDLSNAASILSLVGYRNRRNVPM
jgi:hypothetical protein